MSFFVVPCSLLPHLVPFPLIPCLGLFPFTYISIQKGTTLRGLKRKSIQRNNRTLRLRSRSFLCKKKKHTAKQIVSLQKEKEPKRKISKIIIYNYLHSIPLYIIYNYARFSATSSDQYRCNIGPTSVQSRGLKGK